MHDLKLSRENWYKAFYLGDIEKLSEYESDDFFVVSNIGRQTKSQQIASIMEALSSGVWFEAIPERKEYHLSWVPLTDGYIISGVGHTVVSDKVDSKKLFTEIWVLESGCWRVKALHYSDIKRAENA
ncbi:MAG: nuclear transport factor 2 family protein [Planctomycetes bacterium]|nr:nuclear transport factor 2 family protein [Planctomycetota bacterium]